MQRGKASIVGLIHLDLEPSLLQEILHDAFISRPRGWMEDCLLVLKSILKLSSAKNSRIFLTNNILDRFQFTVLGSFEQFAGFIQYVTVDIGLIVRSMDVHAIWIIFFSSAFWISFASVLSDIVHAWDTRWGITSLISHWGC